MRDGQPGPDISLGDWDWFVLFLGCDEQADL